jgi:DNA replication protein DnaC
VDCVDCGGSGWVVKREGAYETAQRCICRKEEDLQATWRACVPPSRSDNMSFDTYAPKTASQRNAFTAARFYAESPESTPKGLAFLGPVGCGKTHLLVSVARQIVSAGKSLGFVDFDRLAGDVRRGYSEGTSDTAAIRDAMAFDFVVIDELGKGRGTEWESWLADQLISVAYQQGTRLLVASNHPAEHDGGKYCPLEQRIGGRAWSRLQHMTMMVHVDGPDGREYVLNHA